VISIGYFCSPLVLGFPILLLLYQLFLHQEHSREATLLTFVITVSGVSVLGIGSAFWGLVIGLGVYHLRKITPSTARKAQI
jgi:predicted benzoate:H+ symporter BenE